MNMGRGIVFLLSRMVRFLCALFFVTMDWIVHKLDRLYRTFPISPILRALMHLYDLIKVCHFQQVFRAIIRTFKQDKNFICWNRTLLCMLYIVSWVDK